MNDDYKRPIIFFYLFIQVINTYLIIRKNYIKHGKSDGKEHGQTKFVFSVFRDALELVHHL